MKICPEGVKLYHADRQTERHDEANSSFSQFVNPPIKAMYVTFPAHSTYWLRMDILLLSVLWIPSDHTPIKPKHFHSILTSTLNIETESSNEMTTQPTAA
jgi:hypothetical protein